MTKRKTKVLFIGSFIKVNDDGGTGGQLFACTSLINSDLRQSVDWILIDSSTKLPIPGIFIRILKALNRIVKSIWHILFSKIDLLLVFSADGLSILEKGLICFFGKFMGKKVVLAPRSGYLVNDLENPFYRQFIGYLFAKVDVILCQARSWKEKFVRIYPNIEESKFYVRMNWIDEKFYYHPDRLIDKKSEVTKLSFIGWVEKTKGVEDLIYAMHELRDENISLIIAGNGTYFSEAEKLIGSLNLNEKIELVGWVDVYAKLSLLTQSDIFVLPSHFEGMPNAILEAMAAGLPIVATNVGGIPDMINENQSGILIRPGEKKQLADAIRVLIDNPMKRKTMGANAKLSVHRHHSIGSAVKDFKTIILT